MTRVRRLNPEFGYLDPADLERVGASQVVIVDDVAHWSGIVAAPGRGDDRTVVAPDVAGQLAYILDRLDACLEAIGTDRTQIVTLTMYCTELDQLSPALRSVYRPWIGAHHHPALTCIGVSRLARPGLLLEVQGAAVVPPRP